MRHEAIMAGLRFLPERLQKQTRRALGLPVKEDPTHRVFVYGTLLRGERNARWAMNARRMPAWTHGTLHDTGMGFPAFTREGETRVRGELLTVDEAGLRSMDRLEGHPRFYRREEIEVVTSGGRVRAWVYIMNRLPSDAKIIASGDWRAR